MCSSGACVDGACLASAGDFCSANSMCSNGRCGKEYYDKDAKLVCCPSGEYEWDLITGSNYALMFYFCEYFYCNEYIITYFKLSTYY